MEPVDHYAEVAMRLGKREFATKFPMLFLLKKPASSAGPGGPITFRTQALSVNDQGLWLTDSGPFTDNFWVWALLKKAGNPFPDRISIGRATNCDVVLRLSYVSKLHAHLVTEGERHRLVDQGSANGTEVNGELLKPNTEREVKVGDKVKLGRLELLLLDAETLYDVLKRDVIPVLGL
jgi:hypothetical protein